jgi:hypothetical protein
MCQDICPVIILSTLVQFLGKEKEHSLLWSTRLCILLHIIKERLFEKGASVGQFVTRLFQLIYQGKLPRKTKHRYDLILTIFFHQNIPFLIFDSDKRVTTLEFINDSHQLSQHVLLSIFPLLGPSHMHYSLEIISERAMTSVMSEWQKFLSNYREGDAFQMIPRVLSLSMSIVFHEV